MEAIGTLAGGIAHDFNNILAAMMGYAELAKIEATNAKMSSYLDQILSACDRSRDLVKQILTFSRRTEQEKKPIMLKPLIKEVTKFLRASLPTTIEIRQELNAASDLIMADATQIHQLLMNLCANAGYAMKATGGMLKIGLEEVTVAGDDAMMPSLTGGRYLLLTVMDTGPGIPADQLERIFEPYFTTKEKGEGTGLGLSVVDGIVKSHGGTVRVHSEMAKGSAFHVYLPQLEKIQKHADREREIGRLPRGGESVLFIDDEMMLARSGKLALEELGYKVVAETDPFKAAALFSEGRDAFDLVITDKTMPRMTGFDLAREIRRFRADIPIILCSGFPDREDSEKISALGIGYYLIKPYSIKEMSGAVRFVLDKNAKKKLK